MVVGRSRSRLLIGTRISIMLSTPISGDLEHVMGMIFRVAAGLEAKIELAFLHPLLFRLDFGFWELAWCPGAAEQPSRVPALLRRSHEDKLCRVLSFLQMYNDWIPTNGKG